MSVLVSYDIVKSAYIADNRLEDLMTKACYTESFSEREVIRIERALALRVKMFTQHKNINKVHRVG